MEKLYFFKSFKHTTPGRLSLALLFLFSSLMVANLHATELSPLDLVKQSNQQVQDIFKNSKSVDQQTETKLYEVIDGITDYHTIASQVTSEFCKNLTTDQCKTFNQVFIELLRVSSIKKLGRYRADKFDYLGQEITGNSAIVKTIAYYKEEKAELDYSMELKNGKWKITNYVLDDIDTVRNYKKQFKRLFTQKNFDQVIERLRTKIDDYQKENREQ